MSFDTRLLNVTITRIMSFDTCPVEVTITSKLLYVKGKSKVLIVRAKPASFGL